MNVTNVSNKMTIDNFTVNGGENDLNDLSAFPVKLCCGLNRRLQFKQLEYNVLGLHSPFTTSCSWDSIVWILILLVSEWELVDTSARWGEVGLPCCPDIKYSHVVFTLKLSRRSLFYLVSLCDVTRTALEKSIKDC